MLLFIVSALILWALFGRPHQRVPARPVALRRGSGHGPAAAASDSPNLTATSTEQSPEQPASGGAGAGQ
jgi:hypothetical protein